MWMLKCYFLKPLGYLDLVVIALILIWFLLFFLDKGKKFQIAIFLASHSLFYLSKLGLQGGNFFVPSAIMIIVSVVAFIIYRFNKNKRIGRLNKWVYCFFAIVLAAHFLLGCVLVEASSILMPPTH